MTDKKILVVDDEPDICEILQFNLENAGFTVDMASSAEDALKIFCPEYKLILLDVMMGGMSGFKMAEVIRKERHSSVPIIFLTARSAENDLLTGFSAGGDDYISKPFSIHEVIARVQAVLRRSEAVANTEEDADAIDAGKIRIDKKAKTVYADGTPVILSKKEYEVLCLLASNQGKIFSRGDIIDKLWQDAPYVLDRTVDVHIARIRSKLGPLKNYITNRSGFGYRFSPVEE